MAAGDPNKLCNVLQIERPVLLAPMARISGGRLVSAVDVAGGFGFLGVGYGDPGWLDEQLELCSAARFGIGLIAWHMNRDVLDAALVVGPAAVWLSFGDPTPYVSAVRAAGAIAVCQVGTVEEAHTAIRAGAQALVAQGTEAGGHGRPGTPVDSLVRSISEGGCDVPIVAAGGINDADDLDRLVAVGASGVALGTAFYATAEALDTDAAKQRLVEAHGAETVQSRVYDYVRGPVWPAEYTGRTVRTALTERYGGREDELIGVLDDVRASYATAVVNSDMSMRALFAGSGLDGVDSIRPAADIVRRFPITGRAS